MKLLYGKRIKLMVKALQRSTIFSKYNLDETVIKLILVLIYELNKHMEYQFL